MSSPGRRPRTAVRCELPDQQYVSLFSLRTESALVSPRASHPLFIFLFRAPLPQRLSATKTMKNTAEPGSSRLAQALGSLLLLQAHEPSSRPPKRRPSKIRLPRARARPVHGARRGLQADSTAFQCSSIAQRPHGPCLMRTGLHDSGQIAQVPRGDGTAGSVWSMAISVH